MFTPASLMLLLSQSHSEIKGFSYRGASHRRRRRRMCASTFYGAQHFSELIKSDKSELYWNE